MAEREGKKVMKFNTINVVKKACNMTVNEG